MVNPKWVISKSLTHIGPPKAKEPRYVGEDDGKDSEYLAWLHTLPCGVAAFPLEEETPCEGEIHAHHHTGGRGRGQKAPDRDAFPLCAGHHQSFHLAHGSFWRWTKAERRDWQDRMRDEHQALAEREKILPGRTG